ncbi:MAG: hypothetical protein Q9M28_07290 [Mariprofundaceae bacterium]|nr:hypothetical protein [Mariprofundaceae bacterium]
MFSRIIALFYFIVALLSLYFASSALTNLFNPEETDSELGTNISLFIIFSIITVFSSYRSWQRRQQAISNDQETLEKDILSVIEDQQGRTTPEEVAVATHLTVKQATEHLNDLCQQGSGGKQITDQGNIIYVFSGFISAEEKKTAKDAMYGR